jgi:hypothetical protein
MHILELANLDSHLLAHFFSQFFTAQYFCHLTSP